MDMNKAVLRFCVMGLALTLAACGFHLRGNIQQDSLARSIYVEGDTRYDAFTGEFTQLLATSGGILAHSQNDAGAVIHIARARLERRPITLSKQGRANTYDLVFRMEYDVMTPKGEILLPNQEIEIRRDYFNDQTSPLSQAAEENLIRQEMQREAAQLLLRRIVYGLRHADS